MCVLKEATWNRISLPDSVMRHFEQTSYFNKYCNFSCKRRSEAIILLYVESLYKDSSEIKWCCSERVNVAHLTGLKIFCCQDL